MTALRKLAATHARVATGGSDLWRTPAAVLDRVRRVGEIDLDPCGNPENSTEAKVCWSPPQYDGLTRRWEVRSLNGIVYVNFPYSQASAWAHKIALEAEPIDGLRLPGIVTLVAARPDARWWRRMVWETASAVCFWSGRLTFVGAPSVAPFPSAVVLHGDRGAEFELAFRDAGKVVRL